MNTNLLVIIAMVVAAILLVIIFFWRINKDHDVTKILRQMTNTQNFSAGNGDEDWCNLAVLDENGLKILESREIQNIPANAYRVDASDSAIKRVRHMAADLYKGAASVPNKTVEVIFKAEIQHGFADGTYTLMKTRSGEVLADAVDSSGSVVGKGRLIQGGKARQLASGAFQLVSIAVAQSHLADIERSLSAIKDSISEILERQENEDKSRITGAFDYLREIAAYMRELRCPDELSQPKRNAIEGIIKDSYSWRNKLEEDMSSLISNISNLADLDTFGTGNTYRRLEKLIGGVEPLLKRRELFLNLASATNFVTAYLDPANGEFSKINTENDRWVKLIDIFKEKILVKMSILMGKAICNKEETLDLRRKRIESLSFVHHRSAIDQQASYMSLQNSLETSVARLIDPNGNVHVAISFNGRGEVDGAAII